MKIINESPLWIWKDIWGSPGFSMYMSRLIQANEGDYFKYNNPEGQYKAIIIKKDSDGILVQFSLKLKDSEYFDSESRYYKFGECF